MINILVQNMGMPFLKKLRRGKLFILVLLCGFFLVACSRNSEKAKSLNAANTENAGATSPDKEKALPVFSTWESIKMDVPNILPCKQEDQLPEGAAPWGGTVSHHLLTGKLIDDWFIELVKRRKIDIFYILSPSHHGISLYNYALTMGSWGTNGGLVETFIPDAKALAKKLDVPFDDQVFTIEHGVFTLMPYIKKYFPNAKVVAIANLCDYINIYTVQKLADAFMPFFDVNKSTEKENKFLLVSTDFSHHHNLEKTLSNDAKSRKFLKERDPARWELVACDNRPACYILSRLFTENTRCTIQYHTNALYLEPKEVDPEDITSYFFTFFWEE
ncbi:AmmeMemoRadiSam system protein B [Treponema phagedenis]|uniref:AmmeMemoRadiSam system protein B n=1 Tax=Treponema phagedenis TaxID=162 RepID=UPI002091AC30|nr:AmmeMemoRadiSam system protein B [Treponema phagedenis]